MRVFLQYVKEENTVS